MILNDTIRQALIVGHLAHLVTLNKDGSPQASIVWVGLDGDEIVSGHLNLYQRLKNIQRDGRVVLSMVTGGKTNGLDNYLVINGRASVTEGGAPELLNRRPRSISPRLQPFLHLECHRDILLALLLRVFMALDHGMIRSSGWLENLI
jgi:PPOX class probable F420-dependent enzyme